MQRFLSRFAASAPLFVFVCCFWYSWVFFQRILGEYSFLVSVQDYIVRGAAAFPWIILTLSLLTVFTTIDLNRAHNSSGRLPSQMFYFRRRSIRIIIFLLLIFPLLIYVLYRVFFWGEFLFVAIIFVSLAWGRWSLYAQANYNSNVWQQYVLVICASVLIISGAKGFDDAGRALRARSHTNTFTVSGQTTSGDLIATVSSGFLIRAENGNFYLRAPENKERTLLFNFPARERPKFSAPGPHLLDWLWRLRASRNGDPQPITPLPRSEGN